MTYLWPDSRSISVLAVLLDLSAVFNIVDQNTFLQSLEQILNVLG